MKHAITLPRYLQTIKKLSMNDIAAYHREEARAMELLPGYHHTRTDMAVYVVSYGQGGGYLYLNERFAHMAEIPLSEAYDRGVQRSQEQLFAPDREVHHSLVFRDYLAFFNNVPRQEHPKYLMSSYYRVHRKSGGFKTLLQQSRFIKSTEDGKPLIAIGFLSDISHVETNNRIGCSIFHDAEPNVVHTDSYLSNTEGKKLSRRQIEIVKLLCAGLSAKEIAKQLHRSENTIENHKQQIRALTNTRNTAELIAYAFRRGYIR